MIAVNYGGILLLERVSIVVNYPNKLGEAVTHISGYSYKRLLVYYKGGRLLV